MSQLWQDIGVAIGEATGKAFKVTNQSSVGGGCINASYTVSDGDETYFVKLNRASMLAMFEAEAQGLQEMVDSRSIRVPKPVATGTSGDQAFIVMENISMRGRGDSAAMGQQLAAMHLSTRAQYGWHRDNTIGSTPQINTPNDDWMAFWREHRLGFQLDLAAQNGFGGALQRDGDKLMAAFAGLFDDQPEASLLHGDLWGGNKAFAENGQPVIFDPATYYGDREADLAMTELFGSFGAEFYAAYNNAWPLDQGYRLRKDFYNIYHVLNHLNLFGGGYLSQAQSLIKSSLAQL